MAQLEKILQAILSGRQAARRLAAAQVNPDAGDLGRIDAWLRERGAAIPDPD